jgi:hypothetical protein
MIRTSRAATAAALLPIALLVAACGGSTASGSGGAASPSVAASSAPVASATPAASSSSGAEASSGPSIGALPSFDVSSVIGALKNVDSYVETITIDGKESFSATVVTKPVLAKSMTVGGGGKIVVIGDKAWTSQDGTHFQSVPPSIITPMIAAFDPALMIGAFGSVAWAQASTDVGAEQKNGVSTHHYRIDSTSPFATQLAIPADGSIDIWIADDGYLVAVETTGFTGQQDMQIEITKINDSSNKVDEPS